MKRAKVSVIIPAYNCQAFLEEALDSVLAQTYQDWVGVIVDDGSTDETRAIAEKYARMDQRFLVVSQPNGGISAARNRGMRAGKADYFALLDTDDLWLPDKLAKQVEAARQHQVPFVQCGFTIFRQGRPDRDEPNPEEGRLGSVEFLAALARGWPVRPSCVLLAADLVDRIGGFDESLEATEDLEYWLRVAASGHPAYHIEERLCRYRGHPLNHSNNVERGFWTQLAVLARYVRPGTVEESIRPRGYRLVFRNSFTAAGHKQDFRVGIAMFEAYRPYDSAGWACRGMGILRRFLPGRLFWLLSRYFVIPLAWHLERWQQRRNRP